MRAGAGVDVGNVSTQGTILGVEIDEGQTDLGLALEFGGGVGVELGSVYVGAQLAVPMAFHFDDNGPDDPDDYDFEYTGIDRTRPVSHVADRRASRGYPLPHDTSEP